eukprot:3797413-Rhodomonas_salina.1
MEILRIPPLVKNEFCERLSGNAPHQHDTETNRCAGVCRRACGRNERFRLGAVSARRDEGGRDQKNVLGNN